MTIKAIGYKFYMSIPFGCVFLSSNIAIAQQGRVSIAQQGAVSIAQQGAVSIAQIRPDNTLPINSTVSNTSNTLNIDGGTIKGDNLFHSFERFDIPENTKAFFNNPLNIENIFTRVTGNSLSNIEGLISASGKANLFFINPNGINFGKNSALSLGGSFFASTASSIKFLDGSEFRAINPTQSLLTISAPIGLQFTGSPQKITNLSQTQDNSKENIGEKIGLKVQPGKSIVLVGGEIIFDGGSLTAPGGRIELGTVADSGIVSLNPISNGWTLGYKNISQKGDIQMFREAELDVSGEGSGNIQVQGRLLGLYSGSKIFGFTLGEENGGDIYLQVQDLIVKDGSQISASSTGFGKGGILKISASNSIEVSGTLSDGFPSGLSTQNYFFAKGAGDLYIDTKKLSIRDGGQVSSTSFGPASTGNLYISASELIEVRNTTSNGNHPSSLSTQSYSFGSAGNLTVKTGKLIVSDGAFLSSAASGKGLGGTLDISAYDSIEVSGYSKDNNFVSGLFTQTSNSGNAGNLIINTGKLFLHNGGRISTSATLGQTESYAFVYPPGKTINVSSVSVLPSFVFSAISIKLFENNLRDTKNTFVRVRVNLDKNFIPTGRAGNLIVNATELVEIKGTTEDETFPSGLFTDSYSSGKAGDLTINTSHLMIKDGGQISTNTFFQGQGGNLHINASQDVQIIGTSGGENQISTLSTKTEGLGKAGDLEISTLRLLISEKGQANVSSLGTGDTGNMKILADNILLSKQGSLSAEATVGDKGNIQIDAENIILRSGSNISTNSTNTATGGDISIKTDTLTALENSDITANSQGSYGGKVNINAQAILGTKFRSVLTTHSDITANSSLGDAFSGVVNINTVIFDPKYGFLESFKSVYDSSKEVVFGCAKTDGNTFVMTGRNGLPSDPADLLTTVIAIANPMDLVKTELHPTSNTINKQKITHQQYSQNIEEVEEAAGWLVDKTGQVQLVASRNLQSGKSEISPPIETSICLQHQYPPMPGTKI